MWINRLFWFSAFCFGLFLPVESAGQWIQAQNQLSRTNGLLDDNVSALAQDSTGYIWIGTPAGLSRFDGFGCLHFTPGPQQAISNEQIHDIEVDPSGRIWVATYRGLNQFNPKNNAWTLIDPVVQAKANLIFNPLIWDMHADPDGSMWIANDGDYFFRYQPSTQQLDYYAFGAFIKKHPRFSQQPGYFAIKKCLRKNEQEFWIAFNKGLALLNTNTKQFTLLGSGFDADPIDLAWDAYDKKLWLSLKGGKIFSYTPQNNNFQAETISLPTETKPSANLGLANTSLLLASEQGLLQKTINSSVFLRHQIIHPTTDRPTIPAANRVLRTNKGTWFIATTLGVWYFQATDQTLNFLPLTLNPAEPEKQVITGVLPLAPTPVILATAAEPAGLLIISPQQGLVSSIRHTRAGKKIGACLGVKNVAGKIWVLTSTEILIYEPSSQTIQPWKPAEQLTANYFQDVEVDGNGHIWIASFTSGVWRYDPVAQLWSQPLTRANRTPKTSANRLRYDSASRTMWIGFFGYGLIRCSIDQEPWERIEPINRQQATTPLDLVNDFTFDAGRNLWIASQTEGIFQWRRNQHTGVGWAWQNTQLGALKNKYLAVTAGNDNQVYALHHAGLSMLDSLMREWPVHIPQPALQFASDPIWPHRMHFLPNEQALYVPTNGALLRVNTRRPPSPDFNLRVAELTTKDTTIAIPLDQPNILSISHQHQYLKFRVEALYFGQQKLQFQYNLSDNQNEWTEISNMPYLVFQQLHPGKYQLRIRALLPNGTPLPNSFEMTFRITPPFWQSTAFLLLAGGVLIGIGLAIIQQFRRKFKLEQQLKKLSIHLYGSVSVANILQQATIGLQAHFSFDSVAVYELHPTENKWYKKSEGSKSTGRAARRSIFAESIQSVQPWPNRAKESDINSLRAELLENLNQAAAGTPRSSIWVAFLWLDDRVFGLLAVELPRKSWRNATRKRNIQQAARLLEQRIERFVAEDKLRDKLARDLHDDIGSTLTGINLLSKVAAAAPASSAKTTEYLLKIQARSADMMERMSDIIWAVNPANDALEQIILKMNEWMAEILEPVGIEYRLQVPDSALSAQLPLVIRKDWYFIFKEIITNAAKHSKATFVNVSIIHEEGWLVMTIADNGIGFNQTIANSGNGLKNIKRRADAIHAKCFVQARANQGTTITIKKQLT